MKKAMGIKTKAAITAIFFMGILTAAIGVIGYKLYHDSVTESYVTYADTVLEYAYRATLKYSFGDMIAGRDMPAGYEELREELNAIKDSSDIEYLYAVYFDDLEDIHSLRYAINAKSRAELSAGAPLSEIYSYMGKPCEEGGFEDDTLLILQQAVKSAKRGNGTLEGYSDAYGHMLNGYRVIYDSADHAVGLICVEIDINRINVGVHRYVRTVIVIGAVFTAFVLVIYMLNTQQYLIDPIVRIAESSDAFVKKMQRHADPEELVYEDVPIRSEGELRLLAGNVKSMADGVASYMTNLKAATSERERIGTELSLAARIQENMLPNVFPAFPERPEFDIYAVMDPAKEVGGDFYDFFMIDNDHIGLVMADVSGKGIPAALFMMVSRVLIKSRVQNGETPGQALANVNDQLCESNEAQLFVTVWLAVLEISTGKCIAANAGHEHPALRRAGGAYELVVYRHSPAVATMEGINFREHEFELHPGDSLFVYTDGVTEATNAEKELFGNDRLLEALNRDPDAKPEKILSNVRDGIDAFVRDAEQFDDITMLCLKYLGPDPSAE